MDASSLFALALGQSPGLCSVKITRYCRNEVDSNKGEDNPLGGKAPELESTG